MSTLVTTPTLGIRSVRADGTSHGGFKWPKRGWVKAPDWKPTNKCKHGLHFLRPGDNDPRIWYENGRILLLYVPKHIPLDGKAKAPRVKVLFSGTMEQVCQEAARLGCPGPWYQGQSTTGRDGQSTSGDGGRSISGDNGQSTSGYRGHSTSGNSGLSISGEWGRSTSGHDGQSISGSYGRSSSRNRGVSITGVRGRAKTGNGGVILIQCYYAFAYQWVVGEAGKDGIEPDTWYEASGGGKLVKVRKSK